MRNKNTLLTIILCAIVFTTNAQVSLTTVGQVYSENFDAYAGTSASVPGNWAVTSANFNGLGNGSSNVGGAWGFRETATPSDVALGALRSSGNGNIVMTVQFTNNTGLTITSFSVAYNFEQYRYANTSGLTTTQTNIGTAVSGLDQAGSATGTNGTVSVIPKSITLSSLSIAAGTTFAITFTTSDVTGADNGIAIDDFTFTLLAAMPVELTRFTAKPVNDAILLSWATATETDNAYFMVERSADGARFEAIGAVDGAGTSYTLQSYTFEDQKPAQGVNFYRLKQVDFDGRFAYSPVVTAGASQRVSLQLWPQPATDQLTVTFGEPSEETRVWVVLDLAGHLLMQGTVPAGAPSFVLDWSGAPAGTYVLKVQEGRSVTTQLFVK